MDINSLSTAAIQMISGRNQSSLTTSMIKMDAKQQNQMADLLAQNTQQLSQNASQPNSSHQFSLYA